MENDRGKATRSRRNKSFDTLVLMEEPNSQLTRLLELSPEQEKRLGPVQLEKCRGYAEEISELITEYKLCVDDPKKYLSTRRIEEWIGHWDEITKWKETGEGYLPLELCEIICIILTDIVPGKFKCWKRELALKALDPPYQDAERYLTKEEYQKFCDSIPDAVDGCRYAYDELIGKIARKEQEELEKLQAASEAAEYAKQLWNSITAFKTSLLSKKKSPQSYFDKDPRDLGYTFPPSDDKRRDCERVIEESIEASIPESLRLFLNWKYRLAYRLLPSAQYSLIEDVPCLEFGFDIAVVVEIEYWVKPSEVAFRGYPVTLPTMHRGSYAESLENPELLSYGYKLFAPDDLGAARYLRWRVIPCILVQGLMRGNIEPQSTRITEASGGSTSYEVDGFDKEIIMPDTFSKYLKEIGSWQGLVEKGILSSKVGRIVARTMERLAKELSSPETPKLIAGGYEDLINALWGLGFPKTKAEEKARYISEKYPDASLEERIKHALRS